MRKLIVPVNGIWQVNIGNTATLLSNLGRKHSPERIAAAVASRIGKMGSWCIGTKRPMQSRRQRGVNNPNWKGGVSVENPKFRQSSEYKTWRKTVFTRDNFSCVECGAHNFTGGKRITFHVDHIKPYALHPELRTDINNGRTLCFDCHKKTPTYGFTKEYKVQKLLKNQSIN